MGKRTKMGICSLCGKQRMLSFEHVPPRCVFNDKAVQITKVEVAMAALTNHQREPWNLKGLEYNIQQQGSGDYYLCKECNSNTGSWYISHFCNFANTIACGVKKGIEEYKETKPFTGVEVKISQMRPLAIYKAILTMFCDINRGCFNDLQLRDYLLNPRAKEIPKRKYRVFIYLYDGDIKKFIPRTECIYNDGSSISVSEISVFPLGMALYIDLSGDFQPEGLEITDYNQIEYDKECILSLSIPYLECNTVLPIDYRSKDEILGE